MPWRLPPQRIFSSPAHRIFDQRLYRFQSPRVDERAHLVAGARPSDDEFLCRIYKRIGKSLEDCCVHQESAGRGADLAGLTNLPPTQVWQPRLVGSSQTITGAWPPSSMMLGFMTAAASPARRLPTAMGPGESDEADDGRRDQILRDLIRDTEHEVQDPCGNTGSAKQRPPLAGGSGTSSDALMMIEQPAATRRLSFESASQPENSRCKGRDRTHRFTQHQHLRFVSAGTMRP